VNSQNAARPLDVYRFFRDELRAQYIQFIPVVERDNPSPCMEGNTVTDRSVRPEQWGKFLIAMFDEWIQRDVGRTFVLNFDASLAGWLGRAGTVCIFGRTCGEGTAMEHNGDLYSCDHFVEPKYKLGNIMETPMIDLVGGDQQRKFGQDKWDGLPQYCLKCDFLFTCNGECPKNRFLETPDGEAGLNYLCAGYKAFFTHTDKPMKIMAELLRRGRPAGEVMQLMSTKPEPREAAPAKPGRNDACFCGSGLKFKKCHG